MPSGVARRSRSSGWPIGRVRRRSTASGQASPRRRLRLAGRAPDHRQPRARGAAQGGVGLRSRHRARRPRRVGAAPARPARGARQRSASSALDGRVRPVPGAIAVADGASRNGRARVLCAAESAAEVALAGVERAAGRHLAEAVAYLRGEHDVQPPHRRRTSRRPVELPDLAEVRGQERATARARDRRRRRPQPAARGAAWYGEDDAGTPPTRHPASAHSLGSARGDAHPLRGRAPATRATASHRAALPCPAPQRLDGGDRRRRRRALARAKRVSRTGVSCFSTSWPSSHARCSRRCASRSRTVASPSPASAATQSSRRGSSSSAR